MNLFPMDKSCKIKREYKLIYSRDRGVFLNNRYKDLGKNSPTFQVNQHKETSNLREVKWMILI